MNFFSNCNDCLFCMKCHQFPLINSLKKDDDLIINTQCRCGNFISTLTHYLKHFIITSKDITKEIQNKECMENVQDEEFPHDDKMITNEQIEKIKDECYVSFKEITSHLLQRKNELIKEIEQTINQLLLDKERIKHNYQKNIDNNNNLLKLICSLINNYKKECINVNYSNLIKWSDFNHCYSKSCYTDEKDAKKEKSNDEQLLYNYYFIPDPVRKQKNSIKKKPLEEEIKSFLNQLKFTFIINFAQTKLSNLTFDYHKHIPDNKGSFIKESKWITNPKQYTNYINAFEFTDNRIVAVFSSLQEARVYDINTYQCLEISKLEVFYLMEDHHILSYSKDHHLLYNGYLNIDVHPSPRFKNVIGFYRLEFNWIHQDEKVYSIIQLAKGGYVLQTSYSLIFLENLYDYNKIIIEKDVFGYNSFLHECCHQHVLSIDDRIAVWDMDKKKRIFSLNIKKYNNASQCGHNKYAIWYNNLIDIFNCETFQVETIIEFNYNTYLLSHMLLVEGVLVITEGNTVYIMDLEEYTITEKIILNKYYQIGSIVALSNRRLAIIQDEDIYFYKY